MTETPDERPPLTDADLAPIDFGGGGDDAHYTPVTSEAQNVEINQMLAEQTPQAPQRDLPPDDHVNLLGGLKIGDRWVKTATVRELNGDDEEALARVQQGAENVSGRFLEVLVERGLVSVGGEKATKEIRDQLGVGDVNTIMVGIRTATFGPEIEYGTFKCDQCAEVYDLMVNVSELPTQTGHDAAREGEYFEVPLRKGGKAIARIPTHADQVEIMEAETEMTTNPESNSMLLAKVVVRLVDAKGNEQNTAGFPSLIKGLSVGDRRTLIREINKRIPGHQYTGVEFEHHCGYKTLVPVNLMSLFPGM